MYSIFRSELHNAGLAHLTELENYLAGHLVGAELEALRLAKFEQVLAYVRQGSAFYRQHLSKITAPSQEASLSEAVRQLPFTMKKDLVSASMSLCSDALSSAWVYYETTGTTGPATPCPRNEVDSLVNNSYLTLQYRSIFAGRQHIVGVMGPTELHSTGDTFEDVLRSLDHTVVKMWPRSPVVGFSRVLRLIRDLKITALVCTPAVAAELLKHARANGVDPKELGVEVILVLGELITPNRLRNLAHNWNARIFNCMYASQESSILAACSSDNVLRTIPLNVHYELIDPETEHPVAVGDDLAIGELVISHLYKGHKPLLRYRTGDAVRCRAGENERWSIEPIGRVKDIIVLNGKRVYAFDVENAIFEQLEQCFEYSIDITNEATSDRLRVTLEACAELENPALRTRLRDRLENHFGVQVDLAVGNVSNLIGVAAMVSWKAARIHDLRLTGDNLERTAALEIVKKKVSP